MTEPTTKAGRELLSVICGMDPQGLYPPDPQTLVLAIEAEVLPTEAELAAAIRSNWFEIRPHGGDWVSPSTAASNILAALKEARHAAGA